MERDALKPLLIEVVAYAPTGFYHCTHCEVVWKETGFSDKVHREQVRAALPEELSRDYQRVSDWVWKLIATHGERVAVKVIDAASLEGFFKTARHGLRRYPAVLVDGEAKFIGGDFEGAAAEVERRLPVISE